MTTRWVNWASPDATSVNPTASGSPALTEMSPRTSSATAAQIPHPILTSLQSVPSPCINSPLSTPSASPTLDSPQQSVSASPPLLSLRPASPAHATLLSSTSSEPDPQTPSSDLSLVTGTVPPPHFNLSSPTPSASATRSQVPYLSTHSPPGTQTQIASFHPINREWQKTKCQEFNLPLGTADLGMVPSSSCGNPCRVLEVAGDGHCFYRCISLAITGTQEYHHFFRRELHRHMEETLLLPQ